MARPRGLEAPAVIANATLTTFDEIFLVLAMCIAVSLAFGLFFRGRVPRKAVEGEERGQS